jgi:hypothetical protein
MDDIYCVGTYQSNRSLQMVIEINQGDRLYLISWRVSGDQIRIQTKVKQRVFL